MNIFFTICGRAGSKGFQNKNLKEMNGAPLVYYTLAAICLYKNLHQEDLITIAVNTDSQELKGLVRSQQAMDEIVFMDRKEELSADEVPKVDVIKDTYLSFKGNTDWDVIVDLDITSPLRRIADIENALAVYNNSKFDLVCSVVKARRNPYFNMVEIKDDGSYRKVCESVYTARQQAPICYELNGSIYAYSPQFLEKEIEKTILDYNCGISVMPDYLTLDIDSKEDFEMMQRLHKYYCSVDLGLKEIYTAALNMKRACS